MTVPRSRTQRENSTIKSTLTASTPVRCGHHRLIGIALGRLISRGHHPGRARSPLDGDQVPRLRGWVGKAAGLRIEVAIGAGEAVPVLAQVFFPGGNDERLDKCVGYFTIAIECPSTRARPQT